MLHRSNFSFYSHYFLPDVRFLRLEKDQISLGDKRLFEIIEVEITTVDCIHLFSYYRKALIAAHHRPDSFLLLEKKERKQKTGIKEE